MKKALILGAFLAGGVLFSQVQQVKIPQKSSKGVINTTTDLKINYTDLVYANGKITYINSETGQEEILYDSSIQNITFDSESINGNITNIELRATPSIEKLPTKVLKSNDFITNADYIKAKKLNQLGTGFLVGGGTCFLVGGILNLSASSEKVVNSSNQTAESTGSPIPLVIGLAGMGAGLVMKISGNSQMKKIKNETASTIKPANEYFVVTNSNGMGIKMNF